MIAIRINIVSSFLKNTLGQIMNAGPRSKHTLPVLGYEYGALEPTISAEIMELHHRKHHAAYVTNYNAAEVQLQEALAKNDTGKIIGLQNALRFNGGGHLNHSIFFSNLSPTSTKPSTELMNQIQLDFCSLDSLKKDLIASSVGVQGSGWGWLGYNKSMDTLQIATCPNQDPLLATTGLVPLLGIDVWEHAYYLQYKNVRLSYLEAIFEIINWADVSKRFEEATKQE